MASKAQQEQFSVERLALTPEDLAAMRQEYKAKLAALPEPERAAFLLEEEAAYQRRCDDAWREVLEDEPPEAKA